MPEGLNLYSQQRKNFPGFEAENYRGECDEEKNSTYLQEEGLQAV